MTRLRAAALDQYRVLVLPDSLALTDAGLARFDGFLDASSPGRILLGSGMPGLFDGHGRLRENLDFKPLRGLTVNGPGAWFANHDPHGSGHGVLSGDVARELTLRRGVVEELAHGGRKDGTNPFDSMSAKEREETTAALLGEMLTDRTPRAFSRLRSVSRAALASGPIAIDSAPHACSRLNETSSGR